MFDEQRNDARTLYAINPPYCRDFGRELALPQTLTTQGGNTLGPVKAAVKVP